VWRASLALVAALVGPAIADEHPRAQPTPDPAAPADARAGLSQQLADERATIERARATVGDKLGALDGARGRRLAAAYRVLHAPPVADPRAAARRRAAARLLVARDLGERRLLADEAAQLHDAAIRHAAAHARVPTLELPPELARPATGPIARRFGVLEHERSQAKLSRRGIDLEVAARAPAVAPADGVVRYAGPIRGLDQGVIVDHGGYFTVVAKLGTLAVPVGAPIARGDRLGTAARHRVYVEVRVKIGAGGLPIDPEPLLAR